MSDLLDLYKRSHEEFDARVRLVADEQWGLPTPCTEWDVRTLVNHIVYEDRWTVPLIDGATLAEVGDRFERDLLGADPKAAWEDASKRAIAAVEEEGALQRTVNVSWGQIPAEEYVWQLLNDHAIHAWDLARAIGVDESLDPVLVEALYERARTREDEIRGSGVFGSKQQVDPDADRQTRLLALYGRRASSA